MSKPAASRVANTRRKRTLEKTIIEYLTGANGFYRRVLCTDEGVGRDVLAVECAERQRLCSPDFMRVPGQNYNTFSVFVARDLWYRWFDPHTVRS